MYAKFSILLFLYCCGAVKSEVDGLKSRIHKLQCDCGQANEMTSKIIGGTEVPAHKYPWMVTVFEDNSFCGGALLTRQYVLTAAHCVINSKNVKVGIAVHDPNKPGDIIPASKVKIHPGMNLNTREVETYDIALIKLQRAVKISERVRTLCLPYKPKFEQPGENAIVAGWGRTQPENSNHSDSNSLSQFLKEANLTILRAERIIQAQGVNNSGICKGDSGSPLFTKYADGKYRVIGVTSTSSDDCTGPSNYARVFLRNRWIVRNIKDSPPCKMEDDQIAPVASNHL